MPGLGGGRPGIIIAIIIAGESTMQEEVKTAGSDTSGLNSSSDASPCESQRQLSKIEGSTNTKEAKNHLKGLGTAAKNHRTSCPETGWGTS